MMIDYIPANSLNHPTIRHGFFTREGGVSVGEYASLNVGRGSGDDLAHVGENRARVAHALGSPDADFLNCHQVHSNIAHIVDAMPHTPPEGDALVTNTPGLAIGVLTADCVPVLFADIEAGVVGAAHAGWKGLYAGVIQQTLLKMEQLGATRPNIHAAIGPAIAQASYEVGGELKEKFCTLDASYADFFASGNDEAHYFFNVSGLAHFQLQSLGIDHVETLGYDTYRDGRRFFSYRRSTHQKESTYGRQCSVIMLTHEK